MRDIRPVCRKFNIRVVFKSGRTLRSMFTKVKDTLALGKQSNVVYRNPCSCSQVYIGETRRRLEMRLKEHRDTCENGMTEKSAVAEHAWENHPVCLHLFTFALMMTEHSVQMLASYFPS